MEMGPFVPEHESMNEPDDPTDSNDPNNPVPESHDPAPHDSTSSQQISQDDVVDTGADVAIDVAADITNPEDQPLDDLIDDSLTDDDFDAFVADGRPGGFEDVLNQSGSIPPPPRPTPPPPKRKLVRDPYSKLGGVSSGIAHYFGFDVALVRILVLVGSLFTGVGFLVYLAAWIIMPRAKIWPPVGSDGRTYSIGRSSISGRDLGLGLGLIGLLMIIGLNSFLGQLVVPLVLVGGGIWLLRQPAATPATVPGVPGAAFQSGPTDAYAPTGGYSSADLGAQPYPPAPVGQPVPPRSFFRKALRVGMIAPFILLPIAAIVGTGLFFVFDGDDRGLVNVNPDGSGFNFEAGEVSEAPLSASMLLPNYSLNAGEINLDLTSLDDSMFTDPVDVVVEGDFAEIEITVPEDLSVSINADSSIGDITVFGQQTDGIGNLLTYADDDPIVNLDVDVDIGEIKVVRG